jgi:hypothetical protein
MEVLSAKELRIGNYYYYTCEDFLDERKKWDEVCQIDAQDLVWLESNPNDEDFKPIPLTEQWLKDFGFEKELDNSMVKGDIAIFLDRRFKTNLFLRDNQENKWFSFNSKVEYVHQIQNLYFALTGEELTINQ